MGVNWKPRINLIRDSLIGIQYHLPQPEVILYPFLDNILLLHQSPMVLAFWEGNQCIYNSLKDPYFSQKVSCNLGNKSGIPIGKTPYTMSTHNFPDDFPPDQGNEIRLPVNSDAMDLTKDLLNKTGDFSLTDEFFNLLGASIAHHVTLRSQAIQTSVERSHIEMSYEEVKGLLEPFRIALDSIFKDSFRSDHLRIDKDSLQYPNIFPVVRSCPTSSLRYNEMFNYTAGLLLSSKMKSALHQWCTKGCLKDIESYKGQCPLRFSKPDQCLNTLEQPLGLQSRAVSDLVFSSGIVDFGRQPCVSEWDVAGAGDHLDKQRSTTEQCIYPLGWRLFYIPIHVGGTPWMALFTFTPKNPATNMKAWHHNYSFYRDFSQKIAALIRQEAHKIYADLVAKYLVKNVESWVTPMATIISRLNKDTQKLSQVYPFPLVSFVEARQSSNDMFIPGRGGIKLNFKQNPFFQRQVSWKLGDNRVILKRCRNAIGDFTRIEQSIEINAVAQSSHLLKVPLRVLDSIASSTDGNKEQAIRCQIRRILDLHDVASAMMSEDKRHQFRKQFKKTCLVHELTSILSDQYTASTHNLVEPTVSGNLAPRLKRLLEERHIKFVTDILDFVEDSVIYYEPLLVALFDGLLTNAIDAVDESKPNILIETVAGKSGDRLFLCVENSTDIGQSQLSILTRNLNSPGPDMVGITELHWMSKVCWPEVSSGTRLSWTTGDNPRRIIARAMIAEVNK